MGEGKSNRGPDPGLSLSEIMTILVLFHGSNFKHLKSFYQGVVQTFLKNAFPGLPCYAHCIALQGDALIPLAIFLHSRLAKKTGIYYIDSTALPVCHNRRIPQHKVFDGLAARGKTSMGWFFGFKLHLVFNDRHEIIAFKLTRGNVHDTKPVPALTKTLVGKLFGDKGYIGKPLAAELLRRGLTLFTRVRRNMKSLPLSFPDKMLLNARNMAETIIGHIKEFSSLNLSRHRSPLNAFVHILAALTAYQLNPIEPKMTFTSSSSFLLANANS